MQSQHQYDFLASGLDQEDFDFLDLAGYPLTSDLLVPGPAELSDALPRDDADDGSCPETLQSCINSVLRILQQLHTVPPLCFSVDAGRPSPAVTQQRTTGAILSTGREAIQAISKLARCSCFASIQFQMLYAAICYRLTLWYRAILKDNHGLPNDTNSLRAPLLQSDHGDVSKHIIHQPITIGEYAIDLTLQPSIRAQVVLTELQRLESCMRGVSGSFEESLDKGSLGHGTSRLSGMPNRPGSSDAIHRQLMKFLDEEVRTVKGTATDIMNGPSEGSNE